MAGPSFDKDREVVRSTDDPADRTLSLDSLVGLEREGWDALCASEGAAFYGTLMTDEALMLLVDGTVLDRDAVVASLDGAPAWDRYEITDARLVQINVGSAALVYRAIAHRGDEPPFEALMASTYILVAGEVRLALYQQTTVPHQRR